MFASVTCHAISYKVIASCYETLYLHLVNLFPTLKNHPFKVYLNVFSKTFLSTLSHFYLKSNPVCWEKQKATFPLYRGGGSANRFASDHMANVCSL
jgi:hypothetical protein